MRNKFPIHTTLSPEAMSILERYEKKFGAKNVVLEKALLGMDANKRSLEKVEFKANEYVKTGISRLDEILSGGILKGSIVGIIGPSGSGKTILASCMINNLMSKGKQCALVSFDSVSNTVIATNGLGMNLSDYMSSNYLYVTEGHTDMVDLHDLLESPNQPKIIVFDDRRVFREYDSVNSLIHSDGWRILSSVIKKQKLIAIIIVNYSEDDYFNSSCDTLIMLDREESPDGDFKTIKIAKSPGVFSSKKHLLVFSSHVGVIELPNRKVLGMEITQETKDRDVEKNIPLPRREECGEKTTVTTNEGVKRESTQPMTEEAIVGVLDRAKGKELLAKDMMRKLIEDSVHISRTTMLTALEKLKKGGIVKIENIPGWQTKRIILNNLSQNEIKTIILDIWYKKLGSVERVIVEVLEEQGSLNYGELLEEVKSSKGKDASNTFRALEGMKKKNLIISKKKGNKEIISLSPFSLRVINKEQGFIA